MVKALIRRLGDKGVRLSLNDDGTIRLRAAKGLLSAQDKIELKQHKQEILEWLQVAAASEAQQIGAVEFAKQGMALSFAQQRMWVMAQSDKQNSRYNIPLSFRVKGHFDLNKLGDALTALVAKHQILRTAYRAVDGQPRQFLLPPFALTIEVLSDMTVADFLHYGSSYQFQLEKGEVIKAWYMAIDDKEAVFTLNLHHICADGWSVDVLLEDIMALLSGNENVQDEVGKTEADNSCQYVDFAHWQRTSLREGALDKQLSYWQQQMCGAPQLHSLPLDYKRPQIALFKGAKYRLGVACSLVENLNLLAIKNQCSDFMLLHGAFAILLNRYSQAQDLVIATPVAGRNHKQLSKTVGLFANTLLLRTFHDEDCSLEQFLAQVRKVHLEAQQNQDLPFDQLVDALNPVRSAAFNPLFQIMMSISHSDKAQRDELSDTRNVHHALGQLELIRHDSQHAKFDLLLHINHSDRQMELVFEYDTALFKPQSIAIMAKRYVTLLESIVATSEACVWQLKVENETTDVARQLYQQLLPLEPNQSSHPLSQANTITGVFAKIAKRYQNNIAVSYAGVCLTYEQLDKRSNQMAHYLRAQGLGLSEGVSQSRLVGLSLVANVELIVAIMAILKSGCAYVPLDPAYPKERLAHIVQDSRCDVIISSKENSVSFEHTQQIMIEECYKQMPSYTDEPLAVKVDANDLAYVIYTSGSTGKPKGVAVSHRALVNRIHWMHEQYGMSPHDKVLQKTPYSFDVSVWEFVWTLGFGGQLVMAKPGGHADPEYLCELIQQAGITKLHFVPSMLGSILETSAFAQCDSIKQIFCSGEALQQSHVQGCKTALPHAHLHNLYGPTEAAIDVSYWDCSGDISQGVPIGKPIHNIQLMILDEALNLVPEGAVGELHIGGVGLAQGYLNREALTQARFIANPYFDASRANSSPRLYKTGDLARLRPDGNIEYQGRTDHQVKIRGFRIELGEIEHQLSALENVDSALVMAQSLAGSQQLIGYVKVNDAKLLTEDAKEAFISDCKQQLRVVLPEYMVPSVLIALAAWPTTANGKIDRKALPVLDSQLLHAHFVAPQTDTERELVRLWSTLLSLDEADISTQANFFELGGHSLLANTMLAKMRGSFGVNIKLDKVFTEPTITALAKIIDDLVVINQLKKVEQEQEFLSGGVL